MQGDSTQPRPRGTGSLIRRRNADGSEGWYGKWRIGGQQVMRRLGPVKAKGVRNGLTRAQADVALRREMTQPVSRPQSNGSLSVAAAGARHLEHKRSLGLKKATLMDYESSLRI